jgi:hypothetical protein
VTVDLRPGGKFALDTCGPDGAVRRLSFFYVSIAEPRELVFDESRTGIQTTVTLRPAGDGTDLTVSPAPTPPELRTAQAADGLGSIFDSPASYLRRRPSSRREMVAEYFAGFRASDQASILATLTDDVEWVIPGHRVDSYLVALPG